MKYYSSFFIFVLLAFPAFNSYGEDSTPPNPCVKFHDEALTCFNNINFSQLIEAGETILFCGQQFINKVRSIKPKFQGQLTVLEGEVLSILSLMYLDRAKQCVLESIFPEREIDQSCINDLQFALKSLIFSSKHAICKYITPDIE